MNFSSSDKHRLYIEVVEGIQNGMVLVLQPEAYPCKKSDEEHSEIIRKLFLEYAQGAPVITTFGLQDPPSNLQKLGFFDKRRGGQIWSWPSGSESDITKLQTMADEMRCSGFGFSQTIGQTVKLIAKVADVAMLANPNFDYRRSITSYAKRRVATEGSTFICTPPDSNHLMLYYSDSNQDRDKLIEAVKNVEFFRGCID